MPGGHVRFQQGPATFSVSEAVIGGRLVAADTTSGKEAFVKHAGAASATVLGMARTSAQPANSAPTDQIDASWPGAEVAVIYGPADVTLSYSAAAAFGEKLAATADGKVAPAGAEGVAVARCTQPGGMSAAGEGFARLFL